MKPAIKKLLSTTQKSFDLDFSIRVSGQHLILPFYHAVSDEEVVHLKHLYPVISTSRFEKDLDFLQQISKSKPWKLTAALAQNRLLKMSICFLFSKFSFINTKRQENNADKIIY